MKKEELLRSREYHLAFVHCANYAIIAEVLKQYNNNIELFAEKTGIPLKKAKKLAKCGYDGNNIKELIDIMLKLGYYPVIHFNKLTDLL